MSKDPISEGDQDVSRRRLLEKAALAVGAATSVVAARSALARSRDVAMDSSGRVLIHGTAFATEGSFEVAAGSINEKNCTNGSNCTGTQNAASCSNLAQCVAPSRAMRPTGTGPKTIAPVRGGSRK
jgi:hypothetical protein